MLARHRSLAMLLLAALAQPLLAATPYTPPATPREKIDFNANWKFIKQDIPSAATSTFDDSKWQTISTPHTYNDTDTFNKIISHGGGQAGAYTGPAWYRKHFKLPATLKGQKLLLEFEGIRQAATFTLNGKEIGLYENAVNAYGLDITDLAKFGDGSDNENILAVRVDNSDRYLEKATGVGFEWESKDFNPNYGGLHERVWLHTAGKIYQTLPLNYGLETAGTYIYPTDININDKSATINIESQVANESGDQAAMTPSPPSSSIPTATSPPNSTATPSTWSPTKKTPSTPPENSPTQNSGPPIPPPSTPSTPSSPKTAIPIDATPTTTGFRKVEFKGGVGTGGVYINDKSHLASPATPNAPPTNGPASDRPTPPGCTTSTPNSSASNGNYMALDAHLPAQRRC